MSTSYTANAKLAKPQNGDSGWDAPLRANCDSLDAVSAVGALCVTVKEVPSASLNVAVSAGAFRSAAGLFTSYAGIATQALTLSATNYLYLTDSAILTVNTTGFPAATFHVPLAVVVTGASTVTSVTDARKPFVSGGGNLNTVYLALAGGTFTDSSAAAVVHTGGTYGTQFGGTTAEKVGFHGAAPSIQSASANQAAVGALTTVTLTDGSGGTASTSIATISDTATANAVASLTAQLAHAVADLGSIRTLLNQLRADAVAKGLIKGSA